MRISDLLAQLLKVYFTGNKTILFKQIALVAYMTLSIFPCYYVHCIYVFHNVNHCNCYAPCGSFIGKLEFGRQKTTKMADSDDQSELSLLMKSANSTSQMLTIGLGIIQKRLWRNIVGDSDYEDDDFDPEDAYVVPEFAKWDKTRPTSVHDGSN